jgi:hypothetical protein
MVLFSVSSEQKLVEHSQLNFLRWLRCLLALVTLDSSIL